MSHFPSPPLMTFTISQIHLKHSEAAPMASSTHFNKGTSEFYAKYIQMCLSNSQLSMNVFVQFLKFYIPDNPL